MKNIIVLILAFVVFSLPVVSAQAQTMTKIDNPMDSAAVQKASADFITAFNNLEWENFRRSFSEDASVFFPFWQIPRRASGKAAVESLFRQIFDELKKRRPAPPYQNIVPKDEQIQILGDTAILTFHLDDGSNSVGRRTLVFRKEGGRWLIVHLHASILSKPAPPADESSPSNPKSNSVKELTGKYRPMTELSETDARYKTGVEIKEIDGKVSLLVSGQRPLELEEKETDIFRVKPLPDTYLLKVRRDAAGRIEGITMIRPQGELAFEVIR